MEDNKLTLFQTVRLCAYGFVATKILFNFFFRQASLHSLKSVQMETKEKCLFTTSNLDEEEWGQFIFIDE